MSDIEVARLRADEECRFPVRYLLGVAADADDPPPRFPPLALRIDIDVVA